MEEIDIYSDLPEFDFSAQIKELQDQVQSQKSLIEILEKDLNKFKSTTEILERNISELFRTAKNEVDRKDKMIADLRRELDDVKFRRHTNLLKRERDSPSSIQSEPVSKKPKQELNVLLRKAESDGSHKSEGIKLEIKSSRSRSREPGEIRDSPRINHRSRNRDERDRNRRRSRDRRDRFRSERDRSKDRHRSTNRNRSKERRDKLEPRDQDRVKVKKDNDTDLHKMRNNIVKQLESLDNDNIKNRSNSLKENSSLPPSLPKETQKIAEEKSILPRTKPQEEGSRQIVEEKTACPQTQSKLCKVEKIEEKPSILQVASVKEEKKKPQVVSNGITVKKPKSRIEEVSKKLFNKAEEQQGVAKYPNETPTIPKDTEGVKVLNVPKDENRNEQRADRKLNVAPLEPVKPQEYKIPKIPKDESGNKTMKATASIENKELLREPPKTVAGEKLMALSYVKIDKKDVPHMSVPNKNHDSNSAETNSKKTDNNSTAKPASKKPHSKKSVAKIDKPTIQPEVKQGFLENELNRDIQDLVDLEKTNLELNKPPKEKKRAKKVKRNSRSDDSSTVSNESCERSPPVEPSGRILRSAAKKNTVETCDKPQSKIIILENKVISAANPQPMDNSMNLSHDGEIPVLHIDENYSSVVHEGLFNLAQFPMTPMEKHLALEAPKTSTPDTKTLHDILREDLSLSSCEMSDSSLPNTPEKRKVVLKRKKCISFTMINN